MINVENENCILEEGIINVENENSKLKNIIQNFERSQIVLCISKVVLFESMKLSRFNFALDILLLCISCYPGCHTNG